MDERYYLELETFGLNQIIDDELFVNYHQKTGEFSYNTKDDYDGVQTKFTEQEIDKFGLRTWVNNGTLIKEKVQ